MADTPKLRMILLIDDNDADNFLHKIVIEEADVCDEVVTTNGGQQALDFLRSGVTEEHPQPDLIFLDINMPGMNGWEFIEHYEELPEAMKGKMMVVMLTTSINPDDREKAAQYSTITDFKHKPLTTEDLIEEVERFRELHSQRN